MPVMPRCGQTLLLGRDAETGILPPVNGFSEIKGPRWPRAIRASGDGAERPDR
jgi:hypothetical protein